MVPVERSKVFAKDLSIGMYVHSLDRPWLNSPFTVQGFMIRSYEEIKKLQASCAFVYIDPLRTRGIWDSDGRTIERKSYTETVSFEQELPRAARVREQARKAVADFYNHARAGASIKTELARTAVAHCVDSVLNNPSAMHWLSLLKERDNYTVEHSLNVGMFAVILGRQIGLPEAELEKIGLCGMMHDIGKAKVPEKILNKPGQLSDEELAIMRKHTNHGFHMLSSHGLPAEVAETAFAHHERIDGKGYPRRLSDKQISYYTKIVAIADSYDAMTSNRCYDDALSAMDAIKVLTENRGQCFDSDLVIKFVQCIGVYPPGSIAELSNGEAGIVLPSPTRNRLKPKILMLRDSAQQQCEAHVLDFSKPRAAADKDLKINRLLADGSHGIFIRDYHQHNLLTGAA